MIEIMRRDFSEHRQIQAPITENPLETMTRMLQIAEQVSLDYLEIPDKYVAELVIDFLPTIEARPALRFIDNLQDIENSAARQFFVLIII